MVNNHQAVAWSTDQQLFIAVDSFLASHPCWAGQVHQHLQLVMLSEIGVCIGCFECWWLKFVNMKGCVDCFACPAR